MMELGKEELTRLCTAIESTNPEPWRTRGDFERERRQTTVLQLVTLLVAMAAVFVAYSAAGRGNQVIPAGDGFLKISGDRVTMCDRTAMFTMACRDVGDLAELTTMPTRAEAIGELIRDKPKQRP